MTATIYRCPECGTEAPGHVDHPNYCPCGDIKGREVVMVEVYHHEFDLRSVGQVIRVG